MLQKKLSYCKASTVDSFAALLDGLKVARRVMPVPKIIAKITISVVKTGETPLRLFYKKGYRNSFQPDIVLDKSS
jgi:hypothetical protein